MSARWRRPRRDEGGQGALPGDPLRGVGQSMVRPGWQRPGMEKIPTMPLPDQVEDQDDDP